MSGNYNAATKNEGRQVQMAEHPACSRSARFWLPATRLRRIASLASDKAGEMRPSSNNSTTVPYRPLCRLTEVKQFLCPPLLEGTQEIHERQDALLSLVTCKSRLIRRLGICFLAVSVTPERHVPTSVCRDDGTPLNDLVNLLNWIFAAVSLGYQGKVGSRCLENLSNGAIASSREAMTCSTVKTVLALTDS